jgi:hypothetical protein
MGVAQLAGNGGQVAAQLVKQEGRQLEVAEASLRLGLTHPQPAAVDVEPRAPRADELGDPGAGDASAARRARRP